jgi:hypothetical protein
MASDFLVAWQCLSKKTIGFSLWIKLHALVNFTPGMMNLAPRGDIFSLMGNVHPFVHPQG